MIVFLNVFLNTRDVDQRDITLDKVFVCLCVGDLGLIHGIL